MLINNELHHFWNPGRACLLQEQGRAAQFAQSDSAAPAHAAEALARRVRLHVFERPRQPALAGVYSVLGNHLITGSDGALLIRLSVNEIRQMHAALCRPAHPPEHCPTRTDLSKMADGVDYRLWRYAES